MNTIYLPVAVWTFGIGLAWAICLPKETLEERMSVLVWSLFYFLISATCVFFTFN